MNKSLEIQRLAVAVADIAEAIVRFKLSEVDEMINRCIKVKGR